MPRGSEELTKARRDEIIDACASLYKEKSFREITIRDIGRCTSFTRTSIYNYFQTKEEIFLALLQREYEEWAADLEAVIEGNEQLSADSFADAIAHTLEKRGCMLKLLSMNIYDMETNSRLENLVAFKVAYRMSLETIVRALHKFFPEVSEKDTDGFVYAFYPFLFGVYPYTTITEKQKKAMEIAHVDYNGCSISELAASFVSKLVKAF